MGAHGISRSLGHSDPVAAFATPAAAVAALIKYSLPLPAVPLMLMGLESAANPGTLLASELVGTLMATPVWVAKEQESGAVGSILYAGKKSTPRPAELHTRACKQLLIIGEELQQEAFFGKVSIGEIHCH